MGDSERALAAAQRALMIRPGDFSRFKPSSINVLRRRHDTIGDYLGRCTPASGPSTMLEGELLDERCLGQVEQSPSVSAGTG